MTARVTRLYTATDRAADREFAQAIERLVYSLSGALTCWRGRADGSIASHVLLTTVEEIERCLVLAVPGQIDPGIDYRATPREFADLIYALASFGVEIVGLSRASAAALDRSEGDR